MTVDDQADLDIKAILKHDTSDEKKCKDSEQVKEEQPIKDDTDAEADKTLKR